MAKTSKFENTLMDIADFVDSNVYLRSIKDAFTDYVPFIIAGSFGSLLNALIASQTTGLAKWVPALSNLAPAFTAMNFAAVSCMTIPIILLIAMNLAKAKKMPPFITGVLAVICYFAMVPNTITVTIQEATGKASGLSGGVLGAQGLFVGMLVAVLITNLFHWLTSIEKIKIKMPASVPAGIANSFNILIPVFVIIVFSSVFGTLFQLATGSYINEFIYAVVQAPLSAAGRQRKPRKAGGLACGQNLSAGVLYEYEKSVRPSPCALRCHCGCLCGRLPCAGPVQLRRGAGPRGRGPLPAAGVRRRVYRRRHAGLLFGKSARLHRR